MGEFLFSLSPNDIVYVPTEDEINNPLMVDFSNLSLEQNCRLYKMVSSSSYSCFFIPMYVASPIVNKLEFKQLNKMEKTIEGQMIKDICWKLFVDRLGAIQNIIR